MKILVLGASGMLGASLVPYLTARGHIVTAHSRSSGKTVAAANLADASATLSLLCDLAPDVVINLAGLTDVDRCESHPKEAWQANVLSAQNAAAASLACGAHLIQISTDQVYDREPASNESQACPGNCYAMTKYAGELAALGAGATVLRTNFFGASQHATRRSLSDWLYAVLTEGRPAQVFDDVRFSPLAMETLCAMLEQAAIQRHRGVFNLGTHHGMSKADFAFAFADALRVPTNMLTRGKVAQAGVLKAWRPTSMCMDSSLFEFTFAIPLPSLADEIQRAAQHYHE